MAEITQQIRNSEVGVGITIASTALASVLATAALHGYEDLGHEGHFWHEEVNGGEVYDRTVDTGSVAIGPAYPTTRPESITHPGPLKTIDTDRIRFSQGAYAREFAQDPAAEHIDKHALAELTDLVETLKVQGVHDISLELTGLASAEDDNEQDAGLTERSQANHELALTRAQRLANVLQKTHLGKAVSVVVVGGKEVDLNGDDLQTLRFDAHHSGFEGKNAAGDMVEAWRDGKHLPQEDLDALDELITYNEGVKVTITGRRLVHETGTVSTEREKICVVPMQEVVDVEKHTKQHELPIPKFIILPGLFPIWRRRRRNEDGGQDAALVDEEAAINEALYAGMTPQLRAELEALVRRMADENNDLAAQINPEWPATILGGNEAAPEEAEADSVAEAPTDNAEQEPAQAPQTDPSPTPRPITNREVARRYFPWRVLAGGLALGGVIVAGGYGFSKLIDLLDGSPKTPNVAVAPHEPAKDPCANLPLVHRTIETRTNTIVDGQQTDSQISYN
ncbi:MAG TPA: hypothetical protein VG604_04375 [Candidatus Saccharimonadales bacterium]|nr:hypothetical protein [Candidatus Saccharimonadales bacterium]